MVFRLFAYCLTALFTLGLLWLLGWMWFAAGVVSMKPQEPDVKSDAIVVLTGGDKRVNEGFDLLAAGKADKIFISGVNDQVRTEDLVALWNKNHNDIIPKITLGYSADSTATNTVESEEWIKSNNIQSIRLVTSNYHMARSYLMFHKAMPRLVIYKHPVTPDDFQPWREQFWPLTFSEYIKWTATWLRLDSLDKNPSLNKNPS